jgi:hypothetical protein
MKCGLYKVMELTSMTAFMAATKSRTVVRAQMTDGPTSFEICTTDLCRPKLYPQTLFQFVKGDSYHSLTHAIICRRT